jgi:hypothetical protein
MMAVDFSPSSILFSNGVASVDLHSPQRPLLRRPRPGRSSLILVGLATLVTLVFIVGAFMRSRFIMDLVRDLAIVF